MVFSNENRYGNPIKDAFKDWQNESCRYLTFGLLFKPNGFHKDTGLEYGSIGDIIGEGALEYIEQYNTTVKELINYEGLPWYSKKDYLKIISDPAYYFWENRKNVNILSEKPIRYKFEKHKGKIFIKEISENNTDKYYLIFNKVPKYFGIFSDLPVHKVEYLFGPDHSYILFIRYQEKVKYIYKVFDIIDGHIISVSRLDY